jgi:ketosteroid isomerase-like protein
MNRREILLTSGGFFAAFGASSVAHSTDQNIVQSAKAVIRDHELKAQSGDLDEIVSNFSDEIVLFAPGAELVQGSESFRSFYQSLLGLGEWEFKHDYSGHDVQGESVIVYGVARGTLTAPESEPAPIANNFLLVLRPESGRFKIWRGAFAPIA